MSAAAPGRRPPTTWFVIVGIAIAFMLALVVGPHASSKPDGLEKVAAGRHLDTAERAHPLADSPLAGYGVKGVDDDGLSTGLAGVIGVSVTFAIGLGFAQGLRVAVRRRRDTEITIGHVDAQPG